MPVPPDWGPPRAAPRPIVIRMPSNQDAEKTLALCAAGLCFLVGIVFGAIAPFQDDPVRSQRLSSEGSSFMERASLLGLGTGVGGTIASVFNRNRNSNNDEQL